MKNNRFFSLFFFIIGLASVGTALFANILSLDQSAGWGRARIALLFFGIFIALTAVFYYFYANKFVSVAHKVYSFFKTYVHDDQNADRFFSKYRFTLPFVVAVILIYIWFVSSGTLITWVSPTRYYADLARGFKNGHLYIPSKPDPALFNLSDPYDPLARANAGVKAPLDITYYNGRYYLYWGPVPSLLLVAISPFFHGRVGDLHLVFVFVCGIFLFQSLTIVMIWDAFFSKLPKWMLLISILLMGLRSPVTFMLNNFISARIYEAAIFGGQFFLIGGFLFALKYARTSSFNWNLVFAGGFWALTIGTRLFLALPVGFMSFMLALQILRTERTASRKIVNLTVLGTPLAIGFVCLGWYNWARFDSLTESGLYYQLASNNLQKHYHDLIGLKYAFQNFYNYLLNPPIVHSQIPFFFPRLGKTDAVFPFYSLPAIYNAQLVTGLLYAVPFILFALISSGTFFLSLFTRKSWETSYGGDGTNTLKWVIATLSGSSLTAFGFLLVFFWAAMRYADDFMPSLIVLSVIGFWQGYSFLLDKPAARRLYAVIGIVLAGVSVVVSTLLAISVNDARFILIRFFSSL